MSSITFSWLHISDFHIGMKGAGNLWVQVREKFHQDVCRHIKEHGMIDLVIFSGDITQKADPAEFEAAHNEISALWSVFETMGDVPKLFLVPGNHDLVRPKDDSTLLAALDSWRKRPSNVESLLRKEDHDFRKEVKSAFSNYVAFFEKLRSSNIPLLVDKVGVIPGDCSGVMEVNGINVGVVGLNSAWSQLEQTTAKGELEFAVDQIHEAVNQDVTNWIESNNLNLLVTHHPVSWFTKQARQDFLNEVNPLHRFDAHLFGHMHEHHAVGQEFSQSSRKRDIQVASLFGLEKIAGGTVDRTHGYYFAAVIAESDQLKIWPRKAESVIGGGWRINEDRFSLPDGGDNVIHTLKVRNFNSVNAQKKNSSEAGLESFADVLALHSTKHMHVLTSLRHPLMKTQRYMVIGAGSYNIDTAVTNLTRDGICWVVSSWNMAGDDFLSCVDADLGPSKRTWFRLSMFGYSGQNEFAQNLDREFGFSIVDLCNLLAKKDDAVLLLDDAPINTLADGKTALEEIVNLSQTIIEFCHGLKIVIRTTSRQVHCALEPVVLQAMDEADFNQYLLAHPEGGLVSASGMRPEDLYKLTNGEPAAVHRTLSKLRFSRVEDITFEDSRAASIAARSNVSDAPETLKLLISGLRETNNDRIYSLLQCLTILPNGEEIDNIRNFDPDMPFFPKMAEQLFDLGLIETIQFSVFKNESEPLPKVLVAKRSVQEHIWGVWTKDELEAVSNKAVSLYFGRNWMLGRFRLNSEFKLDKVNQTSYSMQNAATLLRRMVNDALLSGDGRSVQNSVALLNYYTAKLDGACQYRAVCDTCHNLIPKLIKHGYSPAIQDIVYKYAKSLRMLGDRQPALDILKELLDRGALEKSFKARVLIDVAYCLDSMNDSVGALAAAKEVLALKDKQAAYYHARTIIVSNGPELNRLAKLRALEKRCRNKKYFTAANNIAVQVISEFETDAGRKDLYRAIASRARADNDTFNFIKSTVHYARLAIQQGDKLQNKEIYSLIVSYHYLCSQRMTHLFKQAHECLWSEFERLGESLNLVILFKQSSLLFRLNADEVSERKYLRRFIVGSGNSFQSILNAIPESDRIYIVNRMLRLGLATIKNATPESRLKLLSEADLTVQ
ncbi:metallophosphoesterase [Pseudomonas alliivorans]|nr:metallophosphoesterase [Pseudomonas alliivorans]